MAFGEKIAFDMASYFSASAYQKHLAAFVLLACFNGQQFRPEVCVSFQMVFKNTPLREIDYFH